MIFRFMLSVFLLLLVYSQPIYSSQCLELPEEDHPVCIKYIDDKSSTCDECACLFNHGNCSTHHLDYCTEVSGSLGFNCTTSDGPTSYLLTTHNDTTANLSNCLIERVCHCLSREANYKKLIEVEELCHGMCTHTNTISASGNNGGSGIGDSDGGEVEITYGVLYGNDRVCDRVHSQYCRRHEKEGRSVECAGTCVEEKSCEILIEGILEEEFEQSDFDAALSVLREFGINATNPQNVADILKSHSSLFIALDRNEEAAITFLNDNSSKVLLSLFDDLLSDSRHHEWNDLQQEDESPGVETLERIERTSTLIGANHKLRLAEVELQPYQYKGDNMEMSVECEANTGAGYTHVFNTGSQEAVLYLPGSTADIGNSTCSRIISAVLSSNLGDLVLQTSLTNTTYINTDVMTIHSVEVENNISQPSDIIITLSSLNITNESSTASCMFWNTTISEWSMEGVKLLSKNETHYTCQSNHLTSFAVLVSTTPVHQTISTREAQALSTVTYAGCTISIFCLIQTLFWMVVLRKVLQKGILLYIHFNLFMALLLALIVYVSGIETATHIKWLCSTVAALLHYLFLCVFCWMLAEGIVLYMLIVRVFSTEFKRWYYLLPLGWGVPIPIVAVSVGIRHESYGTNAFCWLSVSDGVVWSFIGPMLVVILINTVILIVTIVCILRVKRKASNDLTTNNLNLIIFSVKSTVILLPLLGITWIIGLFAVNQNTTIFAWIFTILNSLQGATIFLLHILRNRKALKKMFEYTGLNKIKKGVSTKFSGFTRTGSGSEVVLDGSLKKKNTDFLDSVTKKMDF